MPGTGVGLERRANSVADLTRPPVQLFVADIDGRAVRGDFIDAPIEDACILHVDGLYGGLTLPNDAENDLPRVEDDVGAAVGRNAQGRGGRELRADRHVDR